MSAAAGPPGGIGDPRRAGGGTVGGVAPPKPRAGRVGLRLRFVAALVAVVGVVALGFVYAIHAVVDELEAELQHSRLDDELREFVAAYRHDPTMPLIALGGVRRYAAEPGALSALPAPLQDLPVGVDRELRIGEADVLALRADVAGTRLIVTLDLAPVRSLERRVLGVMWLFLLLGAGLAVVAALALATLVTRPVAALADTVARLDPGNRHERIAHGFRGREVELIADAFDQFLARLEAFVAREQAFTEDASHELRTPLSVILSAVDLLREEPGLRVEARARLERIARAGEQMQGMIGALLFLAREDSDAGDQTCDAAAVVRDAVAAATALPEARDVAITVGELEPCRVRAPASIVASVAQNLIVNALTHTGQGRVDLRLVDGVLSVADTGTGIAPEDLGRIFERRYRGTHSRGLGLGLYLVKRICDRLGWHVAVSSRPGQGAEFRVNFAPQVPGADRR